MPSNSVAKLQREIGSPGLTVPGGTGETWEENPELRWPLSAVVYDRMRRTDGQIASIRRSIGLPIRRTAWTLMGDEVDPRVVAFVEAELGLQTDQRGRTRRVGQGISWDEFLRHALLHLDFGHMAFEQVYEIGPPPAGIAGMPPLVAHLRKLGPRMPRTISRWDVARDGGLRSIWVRVPDTVSNSLTSALERELPIPVDQLVVFVNEKEGADWTGQSIYRAAWKHWMLKEKLIRLAAMIVERNGMGVPIVYHPEGEGDAKARSIAANLRAGEYAGADAPDDWRIEIQGVQGTTVDPLPLIQYHDQAMARSVLAMFLDLGHDNGARSLGETFVDFFTMSLNAVTGYIEEVVAEHVIADLVRLNFGPDEPYPVVVADEITSDTALSPKDLAELVKNGIVLPDQDLEDDQRRRFGLPSRIRNDVPVESQLDPVIDLAAGRRQNPTLEVLEAKAANLQARIDARRSR